MHMLLRIRKTQALLIILIPFAQFHINLQKRTIGFLNNGITMKKSMPLEHARWLLLMIAFVALSRPACAQPRGASTIEAAPPGQAYDYVVHVQNTYDYRYNPEVQEDRILLARQIVRKFCARNQIVSESKFKTEIFGLITGRPDYRIYVKCLS
jgi:hypothetical protein